VKKLVLGQALLLFLALALQLSIKPSTEATIALWALVVLVAIALGLVELHGRGQPWKWLADKIYPHLPETRVVVHPPNIPSPVEPGETVPSKGEELTFAIDDLRDELGTIIGRLEPVIRSRQWNANIDLPSEAYHRHKQIISARSETAREALRDVYVNADNANRYVGGRFVQTGRLEEPITPTNLKKKANVAKDALDEIRPREEPIHRTGVKVLPPRR
jgi:hypothetical protein